MEFWESREKNYFIYFLNNRERICELYADLSELISSEKPLLRVKRRVIFLEGVLKSIEGETPFSVNKGINRFKVNYAKDNLCNTFTLDILCNELLKSAITITKMLELIIYNFGIFKLFNNVM